MYLLLAVLGFAAAWAFFSSRSERGFSLRQLLLCGAHALGHGLNSRGAGLSCSVACGIFLDQGSNPCHLHWQVDSLPLSHQGSPNY